MTSLTKHAEKRLQQRSIPEIMLQIMLSYGEEVPQKGGTCMVRISRRRRAAIRKDLKRALDHFDSLCDGYMVVSEDDKVITAGHQH